MLDVKLAGYNVDTTVLDKLKKEGWDGKNNITPETISAAYARISRDPRPVGELRADAREEVDKARKSNESIVFKMGHHSVAEHAYLNFDILGLSRLAVESLEEARLCSYTEKSQRYITLEGDFVIPEEFTGEEKNIFVSTVKKQVAAYKQLLPVLYDFQKRKNPEMLKTRWGETTVEGWAKEDARYVLALATECQLGFSANSRNLEHLLRKMKYSPLAEVRQLGQKLYNAAKEIVPSLIILSDPEAFKKQFGKEVSDGILKTGRELTAVAVAKILKGSKKTKKTETDSKLLYSTPDADTRVVAAMIHTSSGRSYPECLAAAKKAGASGRKIFLKETLKEMTEHDSPYREFENINFVYEAVMSSSAFAQMKRHRMMSMTKQPYDPALGYSMPPAIRETKQEGLFTRVMDESGKIYAELKKSNASAAEYILTNGHRRRAIINTNLRELYHIARLRMDNHAQWDIQAVSANLVELAKKAAPLAAALACGKDTYRIIYQDFFTGR